jgi:hypothetical protein
MLELKDRLELGVHLASAVIQLQASEWLPENWRSHDMFFLQRSIPRQTIGGNVVSVREPVVDKPFVRRVLTLKSPQLVAENERATATGSLVQYNRYLLSLGIVLMELWFERPIESFQTIDTVSSVNDDWMYTTAEKHVGELIRVAGENYGFAISRCLNGLRRPLENKSLDDTDYKNVVYADIVCLLKKNLKVYYNLYINWCLLITQN